MPSGVYERVNSKKSRKLVEEVALLLSQDKATHKDFFFDVSRALLKHGYHLEAHQKGIGGTLILIVKD